MTHREFVPFSGLDDAHKAAVRYVYESSFPLALRAPWQEIEDHRPDERLLVLLDDDSPGDPPVGLVLYRRLGDTSMSFVRYFVVDGQRRGLGHGSALFASLVVHLRDAGQSMILLDVEDPDGRPADSEDRRHDVRRIAFYERLGLHLLPIRGYAPPDHGQEGEEAPLLLMGAFLSELGADGHLHGPAPAGPDLQAAVIAVYRDRYGLRPDHPVVRGTLQGSGL